MIAGAEPVLAALSGGHAMQREQPPSVREWDKFQPVSAQGLIFEWTITEEINDTFVTPLLFS